MSATVFLAGRGDDGCDQQGGFLRRVLFIFFGAVFGLQCLGLEMGTMLRMGSGYFPAVLSVVLLGLGLAIVFSSIESIGADIGNYAWRGMVFILAAPVFFELIVRDLGFVPSIFLTT